MNIPESYVPAIVAALEKYAKTRRCPEYVQAALRSYHNTGSTRDVMRAAEKLWYGWPPGYVFDAVRHGKHP